MSFLVGVLSKSDMEKKETNWIILYKHGRFSLEFQT